MESRQGLSESESLRQLARQMAAVADTGELLSILCNAAQQQCAAGGAAVVRAAQETADPDSVYNYTRRMIVLRAKTLAFVYGDYKDLDPEHPHIFVYTRTLGSDRYLVIHNFSAQPIAYTLPDSTTAGALITDNYSGHETNTNTLHLKGWESRIYKQ